MDMRSAIGKRLAVIFFTTLLVVLSAGCVRDEAGLVIYTARNEPLIRPIFERYTEETGVPITFVTDKAEALMQRLDAEGANTPTDILMTVDAGNLWFAARSDLLAAVDSRVLAANIPAHLRDPGNRWFGMSVRARTIVYNTDKVDPTDLEGYVELGNERWHGRLCLRTSKKVYNQSLVAMLIAAYGEARTEEIVAAWIENLAADVFANDTQVLRAVAVGQCDVGIVNSYYLGRLLKEEPALPLRLFWPPAETGGVHVNVSGVGVTRYANHYDEAVRFLEWLSSGEAQQMFASLNLEFPANPNIAADPLVAGWGEFSPSQLNLARAGELQADAVRLMDRVGYH